jgi:hypothetical protein
VVGVAGAKPRRARTCARPGCHNIFGVLTVKKFCTPECAYAVHKANITRRKFRIITCRHPDCANLFRPARAQQYCTIECRVADRRCSTCAVLLPPDTPGTKNRYCRLCDRVKKYGITAVEYNALLAEQAHRCWICGTEHFDGVREGMDSPLVVDHCHDTGRVRGLLCPKCNMAIGLLGDDPSTAQAAADYLRSHKKVRAA